MLSPSLSRITKRILSSITELSFHGIHLIRPLGRRKSVTHVSGTFCSLCVGTATLHSQFSQCTVLVARASGVKFLSATSVSAMPKKNLVELRQLSRGDRQEQNMWLRNAVDTPS